MSRLSIERLRKPRRRDRIDLHPDRPLDCFGNPQEEFETKEACKREDDFRSRRLCKVKPDGLFSVTTARRLGERLGRKWARRSLASRRNMRRLRIRFGGAAYRLVIDSKWNPDQVSVFTVNPLTWEYQPSDLNAVDPRRLMEAFRAELLRLGAAAVDGFLIAVLHGEFEPEEEIYVLHVHGVAAGGMIAVLDELRRVDNYKANRKGYLPGSTNVRTRVKISREPLTDLLYTLTYLLKSYWPSKRIGPVGEDGKIKRQREHHRIPEPYHSQVLLWLDRWSLSDITLLMKVRVGPDGFVLTGNQADGRTTA